LYDVQDPDELLGRSQEQFFFVADLLALAQHLKQLAVLFSFVFWREKLKTDRGLAQAAFTTC
jgi:hypothetical protein